MADQELQVKFGADMQEWDAAVAKAKADLSLLDGYLRKAAQAHTLSARATKQDTVEQNLLIAALNNLKRGMADTNAAITKNTDALKNNASQGKSASKGFDQTGVSLASLAKGYLTVSAVMQAGRIFLDSTKEVTKYENQLKVASGTTEEYAKNTQFLEGLAAKYNKNVIDLGSNFAKLTIATKGTNLEGAQTEKLFAAVTATSAALQMSVDDTNGTFNAFIQMVSKGNVQAEELRGQLGERLYGAFNLAAKSMGVTTQELNKMLEQGEVLAADLLPKLTAELENTFGADAEKNAHNLGSAIDYATGQLTLLIAEAGKTSGFTAFLTQAAKDAGGLLSQLRLLNKEKGFMAAAGGLAGSLLETGSFGAYSSPALDFARGYKGPVSSGPTTPQSVSSSEDYAKQFGIRDTSTKAEEKIRKANESAANKAETAVNKWVSEQIQASKDRLAEEFLRIEAQNKPDYKFHGSIGAVGQIKPKGMNTGFRSLASFEMETKLSSDTSSTEKAMIGIAHVMEKMNSITPVDWKKMFNTEELKKQNRELAERSIELQDSGDQLNEAVTGSFRNAAASAMEGIGSLVAGIVTGTSDLSNIGDAFLGIMANLFENIGQALAAHAATLLIAKIAISSNNIAGVAIGAAMAYAAAAVVKSQIADSGAQAFWTGGVVQGQGVDRVPAMLTPGEMILTQSHQSNLLSFLDGAHSASAFGGSSGNYEQKEIKVRVVGEIRNDRVALANKDGERRNRYFT